MTKAETDKLAAAIAEKMKSEMPFCSLGLTPADVAELKGLTHMIRQAKDTAGKTVIALIITLLFSLIGLGIIFRIKG